MVIYGKILCVVLFFSIFHLNAQQPIHYWTFDGKDSLLDVVQSQRLNTESYKANIKRVNGIVGLAIRPESRDGLIVTDLMKKVVNLPAFTLEFAFKGSQFSFATFPAPDLRISFHNPGISIGYSVRRADSSINERWDFLLNGTGITSYNNLADDKWHHFVFVGRRSGKLEIWIDGQTDSVFTKSTSAFDSWVINGRDAFKTNSAIDELAFYAEELSPELIWQHAYQLANGKHYTFSPEDSIITQRPKVTKSAGNSIDKREFAPGYPEYTVQATDQLTQFPLPRYSEIVSLPRNFPWMDITYLHRQLPQNGGRGFGKVNPQTSVRLTKELAQNWNYYIELPTLRMDSASAQQVYNNPSEVFQSLINFANANPQIPAATILMQVQNNPSHAGFSQTTPYVVTQKLPNKYYLSDKSGTPILYNGKKWLNPFTSIPLIRNDALTSVFYLKQLASKLTRKVEMISENGEWFGHKWPPALLKQSPEVTAFTDKEGMDFEQFNGWMQNLFDSVYKTTILNNIPWERTKFTFYNVSAYNSQYWPAYEERILTNSLFQGTPRSTPSFYPARPDNWRIANGPLNGYGAVAEGRKKELKLGVTHFAPFIGAGWGLEEVNIRPAQWLGLLKSMVMLGADFFHVGYFNVTGKAGWANGVGPNDPRGYIYQAAMPSYAQAIASNVWEFIDKGMLLEDSLTSELRMPFSFAASSPNHLVLVRKLGKKYLISGTIQPSSNYMGNSPVEANTSIFLEGQKISFKIRRQGSMYILDLSAASPVFYQLDGWHQYEHPYYWSKNYFVEAENIPDSKNTCNIYTEVSDSSYLNYKTYRRLVHGDTLKYTVKGRDRQTWDNLELRCRKISDKTVVNIRNGSFNKCISINKDSWAEITVNINTTSKGLGNEWEFYVKEGVLDLDYLEWTIK